MRTVSRFPMFEQKLRERVVDRALQERTQPCYGMVLQYNKRENTANIVMSMPGSDQIGQIYNDVPCPTQMGIQTVAPEPGRGCWVIFEGPQSNPMITHFFSPNYSRFDYGRQYRAKNDVPRYMMEL